MSFSVQIAAIDVGSNAVRLIFGEIDESYDLHITKKIRQPIRLGQDSFSKGRIGEKSLQKIIHAFLHFRAQLLKRNVLHYRAVATSALREARNGRRVVEQILQETGIKLELISEAQEGKLIHDAIERELNLTERNVLLVDVGGGSVELTHSQNRVFKECESFPMGTVRLLESLNEKNLSEENLSNLIDQEAEAFSFIRRLRKKKEIDFCVGTGGNFDCLGKLAKKMFQKKSDHEFNLKELEEMIERLSSTDSEGRMKAFKFDENRADVILPAALLIKRIMQEAQAQITYVPHVGLKEGVLYELQRKITTF